jgi:hypothetical protein
MLRKITLSLVVVFVFAAVPALAGDKCQKGNFVGSYTSAQLNRDIFGDGSVLRNYAVQLTLHSDGTAILFFTGFPDYTMTLGTGTSNVGSWTCRADDKLIVNLIHGFYLPTTVDGVNDIVLFRHFRDTYLFTITDDNTLTRTEFRRRRYLPAEDPTDPAAGALLPLNTMAVVFKRMIASDADLLAP